jgi:hypothetical protein
MNGATWVRFFSGSGNSEATFFVGEVEALIRSITDKKGKVSAR